VAERLVLVDYGAGNLRSVENALRAAGAAEVEVSADPEAVAAADRIVLPGVGAFAACMNGLTSIPGMVEALHKGAIERARPFLGICVGMQLMADTGVEYGNHPGLGWIPGRVERIEPADPAVKVPHMGWNDVVPGEPHPLIAAGEAYFLHSYAFLPAEPRTLLATTDHGGRRAAAIGRDNLIGVQFHPEKSQRYGQAFLGRFLDWTP
jgi:glutamine amidotransferase